MFSNHVSVLLIKLRQMVLYLCECPPLVMALIGIVTSGIIGIPIMMLGIGWCSQYLAVDTLFTHDDIVRISWVGVVGAQGSAVSLIIRLAQLVDDDQPAALHFLNGLLKPFVGMTFAHLSYSVFESGMIAKPVLAEGREVYFAVAVAFVAGFSERFAKDLVNKIPGAAGLDKTE